MGEVPGFSPNTQNSNELPPDLIAELQAETSRILKEKGDDRQAYAAAKAAGEARATARKLKTADTMPTNNFSDLKTRDELSEADKANIEAAANAQVIDGSEVGAEEVKGPAELTSGSFKAPAELQTLSNRNTEVSEHAPDLSDNNPTINFIPGEKGQTVDPQTLQRAQEAKTRFAEIDRQKALDLLGQINSGEIGGPSPWETNGEFKAGGTVEDRSEEHTSNVKAETNHEPSPVTAVGGSLEAPAPEEEPQETKGALSKFWDKIARKKAV